ncbi:unnamed protein product [Adineta ricciae]|uniref:Uncharacterized protein n=1 Tax=Adineta ricciae TaxID=249248 RepID=A0A813VA04_ADIRI|nr:unnamed protein product [Adineta ricciae]
MTRPSARKLPRCYSYFLVIVLLFQFIHSTQSLALSSLCGQFGHSCFGGNWGKREASTSTVKTDLLQANLDDLDGGTELTGTADEDVLIKNLLLEEIRLSLLRQRLRHLLKLE